MQRLDEVTSGILVDPSEIRVQVKSGIQKEQVEKCPKEIMLLSQF